jgi:glycosyltransferase involved in cell wall biosynthesis
MLAARAPNPGAHGSTLAGVSAAPDIAIVSLGTTLGWRHADEALALMLEDVGCSCEVVPIRIGRAGRLRRSMALTDMVEALAARRSAAGLTARAVIFSSITAALLQRPGVPYAVRFDTLAALSRPGIGGAWQRRREPAVLARARLLLPWSQTAARTAETLVKGAAAPRVVTLPVPIELRSGAGVRDLTAVAYAANPAKRGLELLCEAWRGARPPGGCLIVGGIDRGKAQRCLGRAGLQQPPAVEWAGELSREDWRACVARARVFINASRYEDWGIAQLEALAAGTPLVTVPTPGPNEALALARRLAPELVAPERSVPALARAIQAGLSLTNSERVAYGTAAEAMLEPYGPAAVRRTLAQEVVPALLRSSS